MRIRVLGSGWYGSHLALAMLARGHEVELHETAGRLFSGASGSNPARLHQGFHYPRSALTRAACREHNPLFLARYGHLTRGVPVNVYAIARGDSLIDFGTYVNTLRSEGTELVVMHDAAEYGFANVEGAVLTGERHIVIDKARAHFAAALGGHVHLEADPADPGEGFDLTLDCTFCARDGAGIDRYEPCLTVLLEGPSDVALTIMDGRFPSLYPWDEERGLVSLTSAEFTPFSKTCRTYAEARHLLDTLSGADVAARGEAMLAQMAQFWPRVRDLFRPVAHLLSIRAMPRSAADARLVDVVETGPRTLRIRAGKIDAIFAAEHMVAERIDGHAAPAPRRALPSPPRGEGLGVGS